MKGTVTLEFSRVSKGTAADIKGKCDIDELDAFDASCLIAALCDMLGLDFHQRAIILQAVAVGALDGRCEVGRGTS